MPTTKEIEDAQQQIHDVLDADYIRTDGAVTQFSRDAIAPDDAIRFTELEPEDQFFVLTTNAHWDGFSTDQSLDVIDRVMEGHGSEQWMGEIVASDQQAVFDEVRADEHADRVRDLGEADAVTYADRMADAYAVQADALGPEKPPPSPITLEALDDIESGWPTFREEQLAEVSARYHGHAEEEDLER